MLEGSISSWKIACKGVDGDDASRVALLSAMLTLLSASNSSEMKRLGSVMCALGLENDDVVRGTRRGMRSGCRSALNNGAIMSAGRRLGRRNSYMKARASDEGVCALCPEEPNTVSETRLAVG